MKKHILSKSKYIRGLQCVLAMYLDVYNPDLALYPPHVLERFRAGRAFEASVKASFGVGIDVSNNGVSSFDKLPDMTNLLLSDNEQITLFEAAFMHEGVLVLTDILQRLPNNSVRIFEVKNATKVSDVFLQDVFVQYYVVKSAIRILELAIDSFSLIYNDGNNQPVTLDLTQEAENHLPAVAAKVVEFKDILQGFPPIVPMGQQCSLPYECPYAHYCRRLVE